jgi:two-component system, NtrC family, sensor histidine kinase KinB
MHVKAYRTSAKIKLGLIAAAVLIAVASLWYTDALANRLMSQEREAIQLWARAQQYLAAVDVGNPHLQEFDRIEVELGDGERLPQGDARRRALSWARSMPASDEIDFVFNEIVAPQRFSVPAVITDEDMTTVFTARNVRVDSSRAPEAIEAELLHRAAQFDAIHEPLRLELGQGLPTQLIHYGESDTVRALRIFPYVQLLFVALFILVGYLGFSYVRRSEQSNLWVGMAKEAAHQLGTPLSSMMGWIELLRMSGTSEAVQVADELENDVGRLNRVADRFQKIGSVPELTVQPLAPAVESTAGYIRRRLPQAARRVDLTVDVPPSLHVMMNRELFEWVIENLFKNALDAMDEEGGRIEIAAYPTPPTARKRLGRTVTIEVRDTGKGIERRAQKMIFRPGYSTKKRGWGLGLSLAKRIVEEYHGGSLALASSGPGEGTTFRILLPRAETPAASHREDHPTREREVA